MLYHCNQPLRSDVSSRTTPRASIVPPPPSLVGGYLDRSFGQFPMESTTACDLQILTTQGFQANCGPSRQPSPGPPPFVEIPVEVAREVNTCFPMRSQTVDMSAIPLAFNVESPSQEAEKHSDLCQAMVRSVIEELNLHEKVARPPDLSAILSAMSGVAKTINEIGVQVSSQSQALGTISRRLDLLENSIHLQQRASVVGPHAMDDVKFEDVAQHISRNLEKLPQILHTDRKEMQAILEQEVNASHVAMHNKLALIEELLHQALSPKASHKIDYSEVLDAIEQIRSDMGFEHRRIDNSEVLDAIQQIRSELHVEHIWDCISGKFQEYAPKASSLDLHHLQEMQEKFSDTVEKTMKHIVTKTDFSEVSTALRNNVLQCIKESSDRMIDTFQETLRERLGNIVVTLGRSEAEVLRTLRSIDESNKYILKATEAIDMPSRKISPSGASLDGRSRQRRISFEDECIAMDSSVSDLATKETTEIRTTYQKSALKSKGQSKTHRDLPLSDQIQCKPLQGESVSSGSTCQKPGSPEIASYCLACSCGYSCGTSAALEKHLAKFANDGDHVAVALD